MPGTASPTAAAEIFSNFVVCLRTAWEIAAITLLPDRTEPGKVSDLKPSGPRMLELVMDREQPRPYGRRTLQICSYGRPNLAWKEANWSSCRSAFSDAIAGNKSAQDKYELLRYISISQAPEWIRVECEKVERDAVQAAKKWVDRKVEGRRRIVLSDPDIEGLLDIIHCARDLKSVIEVRNIRKSRLNTDELNICNNDLGEQRLLPTSPSRLGGIVSKALEDCGNLLLAAQIVEDITKMCGINLEEPDLLKPLILDYAKSPWKIVHDDRIKAMRKIARESGEPQPAKIKAMLLDRNAARDFLNEASETSQPVPTSDDRTRSATPGIRELQWKNANTSQSRRPARDRSTQNATDENPAAAETAPTPTGAEVSWTSLARRRLAALGKKNRRAESAIRDRVDRLTVYGSEGTGDSHQLQGTLSQYFELRITTPYDLRVYYKQLPSEDKERFEVVLVGKKSTQRADLLTLQRLSSSSN